MAYVYMIISNGKSYIGVAIDTERRLREHKYADTYLGRSIRKHGVDKFSILHSNIDWKEALRREIIEIKQRQTKYPNGFNMTEGGEGCLGLQPSEKAIRLTTQRIIDRNNSKTPEERSDLARKAAEASLAITKTPEFGKRRSIDLINHYKSTTKEQRLRKIAPAIEAARHWSDERKAAHKERMKIALGGGIGWTEERRKKQAERMSAMNKSRAITLENQISNITETK